MNCCNASFIVRKLLEYSRIYNTYNFNYLVILLLQGLDDLMIKTLHKGLFGKAMGKTNDLLNNIMLFRGFEFKKDSDAYQEKLIDLSKLVNLLDPATHTATISNSNFRVMPHCVRKVDIHFF